MAAGEQDQQKRPTRKSGLQRIKGVKRSMHYNRQILAREGSFTPVLETPVAGPRAGVRPRVTNGGGEGTKAKAADGNPTKILTPIRWSARGPA